MNLENFLKKSQDVLNEINSEIGQDQNPYVKFQTVRVDYPIPDGWDILSIINQSQAVEFNHQGGGVNGSEYGCFQHAQISSPVVENTAWLLLGKRRDTLYKDYVNEIQQLKTSANHFASTTTEVESLLKAKELNEAQLFKDRDKLESDIQNLYEMQKEDAKKIRLLEGDHAKIREAIGEIKMNEILGVQ